MWSYQEGVCVFYRISNSNSILRQVQEASLSLRREALSCWLTVQQLGDAEESYTRSAVEVQRPLWLCPE